MKFFIKQNATFPKLRYGLSEKQLNDLNVTDEMLEKCAVTFSMRNYDTNRFKVANVGGNLFKSGRGHEYKYYLEFTFNTKHTNQEGIFTGEFVIDFFNNECANKLKLPISDVIYVIVSNSLTNTTVF
ncbi:MAG: hypothetical protein ACOCVF_00425 [bacterium]